MTNLVATTAITVKPIKSLYAELNRQKDLKRSYRRKYKDLQTVVTTTTESPTTSTQPVMVPSNKLNQGPQTMKVVPIGQDKKFHRKGKGVKPSKKGMKNIVKMTAVVTTLASPSINLRNKLHDKAKHTAALI